MFIYGDWTYRKKGNKDGKVIKFYKTKACKNCEIRSQCTNNKTGREIQRWEHEDILEEMKKRLKENVGKYFLRRCLSEHPFGNKENNECSICADERLCKSKS